jgi:integrase
MTRFLCPFFRSKPRSVYYAFDDTIKTFTSLKSKDKAEANRLLMAMNEAGKQPAMNLSLARVYLRHSDPMVTTRTWQNVLVEIIGLKTGPTQARWQSAAKYRAFDLIRDRILIETQAEHMQAVLRTGTVSTNAFLRKVHNFAVDMNWLPATVIPRRQWPAIHYKEKRAITLEEHQKIIAAEKNPERKVLYQLCWQLGASQGDIARLKGEDVDWTDNTVSFTRKKTGVPVLVYLGGEASNLFKDLPAEGPLFPYLAKVRAGDRATEFKSRCRQLGIVGVTLHS